MQLMKAIFLPLNAILLLGAILFLSERLKLKAISTLDTLAVIAALCSHLVTGFSLSFSIHLPSFVYIPVSFAMPIFWFGVFIPYARRAYTESKRTIRFETFRRR